MKSGAASTGPHNGSDVPIFNSQSPEPSARWCLLAKYLLTSIIFDNGPTERDKPAQFTNIASGLHLKGRKDGLMQACSDAKMFGVRVR